jgi:hypothetical protein
MMGSKGSDVQLGGELPSLNNNPEKSQPMSSLDHCLQARVSPTDRYDAVLSVYVPLDEPQTIRLLRKRLMTARDVATRFLSNSSRHTINALNQYEHVLEVSSAYMYRLQDLGGMQDAADLCLKLIETASDLDRLGGADVY